MAPKPAFYHDLVKPRSWLAAQGNACGHDIPETENHSELCETARSSSTNGSCRISEAWYCLAQSRSQARTASLGTPFMGTSGGTCEYLLAVDHLRQSEPCLPVRSGIRNIHILRPISTRERRRTVRQGRAVDLVRGSEEAQYAIELLGGHSRAGEHTVGIPTSRGTPAEYGTRLLGI